MFGLTRCQYPVTKRKMIPYETGAKDTSMRAATGLKEITKQPETG